MNRKQIFLNISEIASFIGKNPYDCVTPFERLWKRSDSEEYNRMLNEMKLSLLDSELAKETLKMKKENLTVELESKKITERQYKLKVKEIEQKELKNKVIIKSLSQKVDSVNLTKAEQVEKVLGKDVIASIKNVKMDTSSKRELTNKIIEERDDLSEESKKQLLKNTENVINTTHGTITEDPAIIQFEKKFNVKLDTSQKYYKQEVKFENSSYIWYIGGKVDGLYLDKDPEKSYVVEVKSRTKGFFSSLRDYEKVQIQLYIWMLNLKQAKLVEHYNKKIKITVVYRDDEFIEDILESLSIFTKNVEGKFMNNTKLKKEYLNKSDNEKKVFINTLYLSEITRYLNDKFERKVIEKESSEECLLDDLD